MSSRITAAVANAMLDAGIGVPANSGKLRIYTGTQPAAGGGALSGNTLLLEFAMAVDAFPVSAAAILTASAMGAAVATASGTATWYRMVKADGSTVLIDDSVGAPGSGAACIIDNAVVTSGDVVAVVSLTINQPLL